MRFRFKDLWSFDGTVDRGPFIVIGLAGFAIKHNLDRIIAARFFHRPWGIFNYWVPPFGEHGLAQAAQDEAPFLVTLVAVSLPFIWIGLAQTLKRLRSIGWPPGLLAGFFLPFLNLPFFLLLALLPSRTSLETGGEFATAAGRPGPLDAIVPHHPLGAALMGALTANLMAIPFIVFASTQALYGWSLFVALPFVMGLLAVSLFTYHQPREFSACLLVACISVMMSALLLLAFAIEGVLCIAMAAPLAFVLAAIGSWVGYLLQRHPRRKMPAAIYPLLILILPGALLTERALTPQSPLFTVRTAVEIDAAPEAVWRHVVTFSEIPTPTEWPFRLGIAYPMRARIQGSGIGAVRHCEFSTGAFVEPIEVWDEPRLLKFSVTSNPPPMQEWTPYRNVQPRHLRGFLNSNGGQFLLQPLPGGRTRLEGATWYRHNLWPASYWRVISDNVIHQIHLRVLRHIQSEAEEDRTTPRQLKSR